MPLPTRSVTMAPFYTPLQTMFTLILPCLLRDTDETPELPDTPALDAMLRYGRFLPEAVGLAELYRSRLCDQSGLAANQVYASPMWQQTGMNSVRQLDGAAIGITQEEADALCAGLNGFYGGEYRFEPLRPDVWRLSLPAPPQWQSPPIWEVCGHIDGFTRAQGEQTQWLKLTGEIQMWLHARAAAQPDRQPPVNSIWLWYPETAVPLRCRPDLIGSNSPWAAQSSLNACPLPESFAEWQETVRQRKADIGHTALFADDFTVSRHTGDVWAYCELLATWEERFFAPIWQALRQGSLKGFELVCDGENGGILTVRAKAHRAFWKRKRRFDGMRLG